jgi:hypothetical protein
MLRDSFFIYKHEYYCDEERDGAGHALLILSCSSALRRLTSRRGRNGIPTVSWRPEPTHKG